MEGLENLQQILSTSTEVKGKTATGTTGQEPKTSVELTDEQIAFLKQMEQSKQGLTNPHEAKDPISQETSSIPNLETAGDIATLEVTGEIIKDAKIGGGLVLDNKEIEEGMQPKKIQNPAGLNEDTMSNINKYLEEMDDSIEETSKEIEETFGDDVKELIEKGDVAKAKDKAEGIESDDDEEEDEDAKREKFEKDYNEAIIIIDKSGMGQVDFTDEEREKLQRVKKIKLKEVEEISLETIKIKKKKKKNLSKILEKTTNTIKTTNIVLPASGYTAEIKGCSSYELLELVQESKDSVNDSKTKWSLIYNKLVNTSMGKFKDFDDFLNNTSTLDYKIFIYGILCATYPDIDTIPLICQKCNKEFDHHYTIKSLIRAELFTEELATLIGNTIDASHDVQSSKAFHENEAPINTVKRYKLPQSEIFVDLYIQSAHDFIYNSAKKLKDMDDKFAQSNVLSTVVQAFYVLDEEDGTYYQIDEPNEISEIIYSLNDIDMKVLNMKIQEILEHKQIDFGFMNMECPHCKNKVNSLTTDVEKILLFKYQTALEQEIE